MVVEDAKKTFKDSNADKINWSEYELWWPAKEGTGKIGKWLLKHHWMLDKYSIQEKSYHILNSNI